MPILHVVYQYTRFSVKGILDRMRRLRIWPFFTTWRNKFQGRAMGNGCYRVWPRVGKGIKHSGRKNGKIRERPNHASCRFSIPIPSLPEFFLFHFQPWFGLLCDLGWFNALLTAMGFVGLFLGAFVATTYIDRFGRKNAILVSSAFTTGCLVIHAFMPDKYSFMILRVLGFGSSVRNLNIIF